MFCLSVCLSVSCCFSCCCITDHAGQFGTVFLGEHKDTKAKVAVKQISRAKMQGNARHMSNLEKEISTMQKVQHHPHIVNILERIDTQNSIYLVLEYCNGGDLGKYLKDMEKARSPSAPKGLPEPQALFFMKQLGMAL